MSDLEDFFEKLADGLRQLVEKEWRSLQAEALSDANAFIHQMEADLQRWIRLLAAGDLTQDDFEFLVRGKKDLIELAALKQQGLAAVRLDRFKQALADLIIRTAVDSFS